MHSLDTVMNVYGHKGCGFLLRRAALPWWNTAIGNPLYCIVAGTAGGLRDAVPVDGAAAVLLAGAYFEAHFA